MNWGNRRQSVGVHVVTLLGGACLLVEKGKSSVHLLHCTTTAVRGKLTELGNNICLRRLYVYYLHVLEGSCNQAIYAKL
jgi:hypothetical protein